MPDNSKKTYKTDFLAAIILTLVFISLLKVFWAYQGNILIDSFMQNIFLPSQMLVGEMPIKSFFMAFGPLPYQINALLFWLFGIHLDVAYIAGSIVAFITAVVFYLIGRTVTSALVSGMITLFFITVCVFNITVFNYIFPYTPAMTYSLVALYLSLLFCIYYLKYSNPKLLVWSCLFAGIILVSKVDHLLFLPLLVLTFIFKPVPRKYLALSLVSFIIMPVISFIHLFINGLTVGDILNNFKLFYKFVDMEQNKVLSYKILGLYFKVPNLISSVKSFIVLIVSMTFTYSYMVFIRKMNTDIKIRFVKYSIILVSSLFFLVFIFELSKKNLEYVQFSWVAIANTVILILFLSKSLNNMSTDEGKNPLLYIKNIIKNFRNQTIKDKIFIFLVAAGLISCLRSYFFIHYKIYGQYYLPLVLLTSFIFIVDYLPDYVKRLDKKLWPLACLIFIVSISLTFSAKEIWHNYNTNIYALKTDRGTFYTTFLDGRYLNEVIKFIKDNTKSSDSIMVAPRGVILNAMTGRPSALNVKFFDISPPYVELFGEDKIIEQMKITPPDYVMLSNSITLDWKYNLFCKDFAFKICRYIDQEYYLDKKIGYDPAYDNEYHLKFKIYKRKSE